MRSPEEKALGTCTYTTQEEKKFRLYSEEEERWAGRDAFRMTERQAKLRNDAMPKWSALRWRLFEEKK